MVLLTVGDFNLRYIFMMHDEALFHPEFHEIIIFLSKQDIMSIIIIIITRLSVILGLFSRKNVRVHQGEKTCLYYVTQLI